jgi:hypothetical protein
MCQTYKKQCRYCDNIWVKSFDLCTEASRTGKICLATNFQLQGHAYTKTKDRFFFNADTLTKATFTTSTCSECNLVEKEVVKVLPEIMSNPQGVYTYNDDEVQQHLNPAVYDGTMRVIKFGWDSWRTHLEHFKQLYNKPESHSGFTEDEESDVESSQTVGRTPPSQSTQAGTAGTALVRRKLARVQRDLINKLNSEAKRLDPEAPTFGISSAMAHWGDKYGILRISSRKDSISKIKAALREAEEDRSAGEEISSTMDSGIGKVVDRHNEWARFINGDVSSPPRPSQQFIDIDMKYRKQHGMAVVNFN